MKQMFSKHFCLRCFPNIFVSTNKNIAGSTWMDSELRRSKSPGFVFPLGRILLEGEIGYEIKTERTKKLKTLFYFRNFKIISQMFLLLFFVICKQKSCHVHLYIYFRVTDQLNFLRGPIRGRPYIT